MGLPRSWNKKDRGRVLVHQGKYEDTMWLAETPEMLLEAFYEMFLLMNHYAYYEVDNPEAEEEIANLRERVEALSRHPALSQDLAEAQRRLTELETKWSDNRRVKDLYDRALKGDRQAAVDLCSSRRDYEYEGFRIDHIAIPGKKSKASK